MGNMGSNHSFLNTQGPQGKLPRVGSKEWVQTTTMVKYQSPGASALPLTRVPVPLTPASSDIGVSPVINSMSNSTLFNLAFTSIVYSYMLNQRLTPSKLTNNSYFTVLSLFFLLHLALECPRKPKPLSRLWKPLKY